MGQHLRKTSKIILWPLHIHIFVYAWAFAHIQTSTYMQDRGEKREREGEGETERGKRRMEGGKYDSKERNGMSENHHPPGILHSGLPPFKHCGHDVTQTTCLILSCVSTPYVLSVATISLLKWGTKDVFELQLLQCCTGVILHPHSVQSAHCGAI